MSDWETEVSRITEQLKQFVSYKDGEELRKRLNELTLANYVPRHSPETYLKFMNKNECSFTQCGKQSTNHPHYLNLFAVCCQHVLGNSVEECLDKALLADPMAESNEAKE